MQAMAKAAVQTTIRLEPELYEQAKQAAAKASVPLNTWIARIIAREVEREQKRNG
jgi:predicted HicB family RNase H-like nuclease